MSSTTHTIHHNAIKHHHTMYQSTERENGKHVKKIPHRYPQTPPSFEDRILFDQQVATDEEFHARHASNSRQNPIEVLTYRLSSLPDGHVIKSKAATLSTHRTRRNDGNFKCLEHMSSRSCTSECLKAKPMVDRKRPPPAPRPPRVPTPDLSDLDVEEMFPHLDNDKSKDSVRDCGRFDDDLEEKLARATDWQKRCGTKMKGSLSRITR